ncbi:hypothetical protein OQA88_5083 [Cercophora sp. LCS_1]
MPQVVHGELMAILEGLSIARTYALAGEFGKGVTAIIFSDSDESLGLLSHGTIRRMRRARKNGLDRDIVPILEAIIWFSIELKDLGINLKLFWIPGHSHGILEHQTVDMLSRDVWRGTRTAEDTFGDDFWVSDKFRWRDSVFSRFDPIVAR